MIHKLFIDIYEIFMTNFHSKLTTNIKFHQSIKYPRRQLSKNLQTKSTDFLIKTKFPIFTRPPNPWKLETSTIKTSKTSGKPPRKPKRPPQTQTNRHTRNFEKSKIRDRPAVCVQHERRASSRRRHCGARVCGRGPRRRGGRDLTPTTRVAPNRGVAWAGTRRLRPLATPPRKRNLARLIERGVTWPRDTCQNVTLLCDSWVRGGSGAGCVIFYGEGFSGYFRVLFLFGVIWKIRRRMFNNIGILWMTGKVFDDCFCFCIIFFCNLHCIFSMSSFCFVFFCFICW